MKLTRRGLATTFLSLLMAACTRPGGGGGDDSPGGPYPPITVGDAFNVNEDAVLTVPAGSGVLANDTELQQNPMTAAVVTPPAQGLLTFQSDGSFVYTPTPDYSGSDSFSYQATGTELVSSTTTVAITIQATNDPPVAVADGYGVAEDATLSVAAPGLLTNDSDGEGDVLTALLVTAPAHGVLNLQSNGSLTYTPATNYNGPDSFTYKARDGALDSPPATGSITVTPVNDAPVATSKFYTTDALGYIAVPAPGVLSGATDLDGDVLTAVGVIPPASGTLSLNADGSFTFFAGSVTPHVVVFTYSADDGPLASAPATVSILVNETDPGPIYGSDYQMYRYPSVGSTPTTQFWSEGQSQGFVVDRTGTYAYSLHISGVLDSALYKVNLSDGAATLVVVLPAATVSNPVGLDYDSADRLYTIGFNDRKVVRIDPSSPSPTPVLVGALSAPFTNAGLSGPADLAVGPDDRIYVCPLSAGVGGLWIGKFDPGSGLTTTWATAPASADEPGGLGILFPGGIVANDQGEVFIGSLDYKIIFKYKDANADGDAMDGGSEGVEWCTLPYTVAPATAIVMGIGLGASGSVLVNVHVPAVFEGFPMCGIYWLRDRDGNGDANGAGEAIQYSTTPVEATFDLGCIGGRR